MTFSEAISSGFRNYVGFSGRASRSEFWYWILFTFLVGIVTEIIDLGVWSSDVTPFSPTLNSNTPAWAAAFSCSGVRDFENCRIVFSRIWRSSRSVLAL